MNIERPWTGRITEEEYLVKKYKGLIPNLFSRIGLNAVESGHSNFSAEILSGHDSILNLWALNLELPNGWKRFSQGFDSPLIHGIVSFRYQAEELSEQLKKRGIFHIKATVAETRYYESGYGIVIPFANSTLNKYKVMHLYWNKAKNPNLTSDKVWILKDNNPNEDSVFTMRRMGLNPLVEIG